LKKKINNVNYKMCLDFWRIETILLNINYILWAGIDISYRILLLLLSLLLLLLLYRNMHSKCTRMCMPWPIPVQLPGTKTKYTLYLHIIIHSNLSSCNQSRKYYSYNNWFRIHLVYAEWITSPVHDKQTHAVPYVNNLIFAPLYWVQIFVICNQSLFILWNRRIFCCFRTLAAYWVSF